MGIVIQDMPHLNQGSQLRWDRFERADLFEPYRQWRPQGISERQAAKTLQGPRPTLPAWRLWHDTLAICPPVAEFLQSSPGLAFLHRLVIACHLAWGEGGACGMRLVGLCLNLTGLDRFVAASYGAQQHGNSQVAHASGNYRQSATARLSKDRPHKDRTVTQDETLTGGLGLVTMAPASHGILVAQSAQARAQTPWQELMTPALAPRKGRVLPATSDAAPGLLAYVEHSLEAHHAPDLFPGPHELVQAVSGPMAAKDRAAHQAISEATEQLERLQTHAISTADEPKKRGPGRPPQEPVRREHAEHALAAAWREHARLAEQREPVKASRRGLGHASHGVALERGVRRNGRRMAAAIPEHSEQMRTVAQHAGLSQSGGERSEQAERVVPKMPATIACVSP